MVEVSKSNCFDLLPKIKDEISRADFVAVDTEFTGLSLGDETKSSLFDSIDERYAKLKKVANQFMINQIGLSVYIKDDASRNYIAHSYNFYLFPASFGPIDERFMVQASSFEFQRRFDFDFNKFVYEGVSYANEEQEEILIKYLEKRKIFSSTERDIDEKFVQEVCSEVAEWVTKSKFGEHYVIRNFDDSMKVKYMYVLKHELRNRFENVWAEMDKKSKCLVVFKVTKQEKASKQQKLIEKDENIIDNIVGFRRVFQALIEQKKPLLGHNMLMDLLLMYDKFHKPLPSEYHQFKSELHRIFPVVIDTKHLAIQSSKKDGEFSFGTSLGELYKVFSSEAGIQRIIHSPCIVHAEDCKRYTSKYLPHEAGYDAFMCGYSFLRLCHFITFEGVSSSNVIPCTFSRYLSEIRDYTNKVNLIRGSAYNVCLDGEDSKVVRPLLFVQSKKSSYRLNAFKLAQEFSKFGTVDIKLQNNYKALVATGNYYCAKDILKNYQTDQRMSVTYYSRWRHSPYTKPVLWTGIALSGGICLWALFWNKKSNA